MSGRLPAEGPTGAGCALGLVIGVVVVIVEALTFSLLTGRPLDLDQEWGPLLCQMLLAAAPFVILALAGIRYKLPWLIALALTLALWGNLLFEGVSYQRHPDGSGANIGIGLIMMASPIAIAAIGLAVHALQQWRERGRRGGRP